MKGKSVSIKRESAESRVTVTVDREERDKDLKKKIKTPLHFLNHMIETIAWRGCVNIQVSFEMREFNLDHLVCEDIGITFGQAVAELKNRALEDGINGSGVASSLIDEAFSRVAMSFEDRGSIHVNNQIGIIPERVEDMLSADLWVFLEGFVSGSRVTLHVDVLKGRDPHHIFESIFRAFGEALRIVFGECKWRRGTTPGVAGVISSGEV